MKRIAFLALALLLVLPTRAATVTGTFIDNSGTALNGGTVRFRPTSNPAVLNTNVSGGIQKSVTLSTNGYFSTTLIQGNYTVTCNGYAFNISVPAGNATYDISAIGTGLNNFPFSGIVKISSDDTTADHLEDKLLAGDNVELTVVNDGGNEKLRIDIAGDADVASKLDHTSGTATNLTMVGTNNVTARGGNTAVALEEALTDIGYNVKFRGVTGSGDETSELQAAADAVSARGGGTLLIPGGATYTIDSVTWPTNVSMRGVGGMPILKHTTTPTAAMIKMADMAVVPITFENIFFDGNDDNLASTNYWEESDIALVGGSVQFKNCYFTNIYRAAIEGLYSRPNKITVENCRFEDARTMHPQGSPENSGSMFSCYIYNVSGVTNLLNELHVSKSVFKQNAFHTNRYPGAIYSFGSQVSVGDSPTKVTVRDSWFENTGPVVMYNNTTDSVIEDCTFTNWTFGAIHFDNSYRGAIRDVRIYGGGNQYAHRSAPYAAGHNAAIAVLLVNRSIYATNLHEFMTIDNAYVKGSNITSTAGAEAAIAIAGATWERPIGQVKVQNSSFEGFLYAADMYYTTNSLVWEDCRFRALGASSFGAVRVRNGLGSVKFIRPNVVTTNEHGIYAAENDLTNTVEIVDGYGWASGAYPFALGATNNIITGGTYETDAFYSGAFIAGASNVVVRGYPKFGGSLGVLYSATGTIYDGDSLLLSGAPTMNARKGARVIQKNATDGYTAVWQHVADETDTPDWDKAVTDTNPQFTTSIAVNTAPTASQTEVGRFYGSNNSFVGIGLKNTSSGTAATTGYILRNDADNTFQVAFGSSGHSTLANILTETTSASVAERRVNTLSTSTPYVWQINSVEKFRVGNTAVTSAVDISVPGETYGVGWNANNEVPTKNDVYDKIEALALGGGTPGGSTTQLQYNNAGSFDGASGITIDSTETNLTVTGSVTVGAGGITSTGTVTAASFRGNGATADSRVDVPDDDASAYAGFQANDTTTTSVNFVFPAAPFSGIAKWTVSSTTNWAPSQATAGTDYTTPSSTETFTNKGYDASGTGNTLKFKSYLYLKGFDNMTGPTLPNITDTNLSTFMKPQFSNSADEASNYIEWQIQVPDDIDTAVEPRAKVTYKLTAADTGGQVYVLSMASVAASAAYSGTPGTAITFSANTDASGASGDVEQTAFTTLTGWGAAVTAGRHWVIRLARDGNAAGDTSTVDSMFSQLTIEYGVSQ